MSIKTVVLKKNNELKEIPIPKNMEIKDMQYKNFKNFFGKNEFKKIKLQYTWNFEGYKISIYGTKDGEAGDENKTELPQPEDNELYFNDIILLKHKNNLVKGFSISDWEQMYESLCNGFDSIGSSEDEVHYSLGL